ncbi:MAG TPA: AAA family ATPase [Longimicrobium sp.]|nr:AAA family ATPase [Longimicrobium sp.]
MNPPQVVIVAGINGAGKTTAAPGLLREFNVDTYLDADEIARLIGNDPQRNAIRAGRVMHARIDELRSERRSFALETTLSGISLRRNLEQLHEAGYESFLLYLWLPSARLAVSRVSGRVRMGGHHIPTEDILRRYLRSVYNFESVYRHIVTEWRLYNAIGNWRQGGTSLRAVMFPVSSTSLTRTCGARYAHRRLCRQAKEAVMTESQDFRQKWRDGKAIDRVMDLAFHDAVRRHRAANVPMSMWQDGQVREVSSFDIPLPEDPAEPPRRRAQG